MTAQRKSTERGPAADQVIIDETPTTPAELPRVEDPDAPIDWDAVRAEQRRALDEQEIDNARRIAGADKNEDEG